MSDVRPRRFFPGSQSPTGLSSFYEHILPPDQGERLFLIKGGPGTGKSTIMQRLVRHFGEMGYETECFHCSADPKSLDAITVGEKVGVIDASPPHAMDPVLPSIVESIVDFAAFLDRNGLKKHKSEVMTIAAERRSLYAKAMADLKVAFETFGHMTTIIDDHVATLRLSVPDPKDMAAPLINRFLPDRSGQMQVKASLPPTRQFFSRSVTTDGIKHHMDTVLNRIDHVIIIETPGIDLAADERHTAHRIPSGLIHEFMKQIVKAAVARGLKPETFHTPFDPQRIDHVVIKDAGVAFISERTVNTPTDIVTWDLPLVPMTGPAVKAVELFRACIDAAVLRFQKARDIHYETERIYGRYMDFSQLDSVFDHLSGELAAALVAQ